MQYEIKVLSSRSIRDVLCVTLQRFRDVKLPFQYSIDSDLDPEPLYSAVPDARMCEYDGDPIYVLDGSCDSSISTLIDGVSQAQEYVILTIFDEFDTYTAVYDSDLERVENGHAFFRMTIARTSIFESCHSTAPIVFYDLPVALEIDVVRITESDHSVDDEYDAFQREVERLFSMDSNTGPK